MRTAFARSLGSALLIAVLLLVVSGRAAAGDKPLATDADHVAIQGYDPVAYFTDGKAIKGSMSYEYPWEDARWRFASAAHRQMFAADPDRYAPQFGGFCAGALANDVLVPANPEAWAIVDGKLYMLAGPPDGIRAWQANAAANIERANKNWPDAQTHWAAQGQ
jgi:hypothetical protein